MLLKSRDWRVYLQEMLVDCQKVVRYTSGMSTLADFTRDDAAYDGILHNLQMIGEAARYIPDEVRPLMPNVEWKAIVGLRNVIVHRYFAIDNEIVWDIVQRKIPELERELKAFLGTT